MEEAAEVLGLARAAGKSARQVVVEQGGTQQTAHSLNSDSVVCQMRRVMQCSDARSYLGNKRLMGIKRPNFLWLAPKRRSHEAFSAQERHARK